MSHYKELKSRFENTPFLVAAALPNKDEVGLVSEDDAMMRLQSAGLFSSAVIMHIGKALENFAMLVGKDDRDLSLKDIASITGEPYSKVNYYVTEGILTPDGNGSKKERKFSWMQGFVAGVCGSLRRQGSRLDLVRKVSKTLTAKLKTVKAR